MGDHVPRDQPSGSTSAPNPPRQPYIPWEQQRLFFLERMSQHKHNPRQMLFVKNVPQESATRIAGLFTQYKPVETKNLYPDSRITTFMIALPSISATEEALRETDGRRVGNTVISVERYNPKQSVVARRDARNKRSNLPNSRADYAYDEEDYDGYDGDEEVGLKDASKAVKTVGKQTEPEVAVAPQRTRRVGESGGISWANIAGGMQPEQQLAHSEHRSPSIAAPAKADTPQQDPDDTNRFQEYDYDVQSENISGFAQASATKARTSSHSPSPRMRTTAAARSLHQSPPQSITMPATIYHDPVPSIQQPSSTRTLSDDHFYTAPEHLTPPQAMQTEVSDSSRVSEDSSQQTHVPDILLMQRGMLAMPSDTTAFVRRRHCADCAFCKLRMQSQARADQQVNEGY